MPGRSTQGRSGIMSESRDPPKPPLRPPVQRSSRCATGMKWPGGRVDTPGLTTTGAAYRKRSGRPVGRAAGAWSWGYGGSAASGPLQRSTGRNSGPQTRSLIPSSTLPCYPRRRARPTPQAAIPAPASPLPSRHLSGAQDSALFHFTIRRGTEWRSAGGRYRLTTSHANSLLIERDCKRSFASGSRPQDLSPCSEPGRR